MKKAENQGQNCRIGRILIVLSPDQLPYVVTQELLKKEKDAYDRVLDAEGNQWYPSLSNPKPPILGKATTHPRNKDRVDEVIVIGHKGFLGYRK